jgi:hypothetical protein
MVKLLYPVVEQYVIFGCYDFHVLSLSLSLSVDINPQGYDVKTLASPKRFVIGLEISETAARQARDVTFSQLSTNLLPFTYCLQYYLCST